MATRNEMANESFGKCLNCGQEQTRNPHPLAGRPDMIMEIGCTWGCLPCAEQRAANRRLLIGELERWLEDKAMQAGEVGGRVAVVEEATLTVVLGKLRELKEKYRGRKAPTKESETDGEAT